ncbi:hypothetical protein ABEB36_006227 [Hypothenemus hampei]|uniref:C-type lectin domain-containing protein n=1 Tax=Hypothenemus hampei TaxID=57062 RepID=A0ABD1EPS7_HYPHA
MSGRFLILVVVLALLEFIPRGFSLTQDWDFDYVVASNFNRTSSVQAWSKCLSANQLPGMITSRYGEVKLIKSVISQQKDDKNETATYEFWLGGARFGLKEDGFSWIKHEFPFPSDRLENGSGGSCVKGVVNKNHVQLVSENCLKQLPYICMVVKHPFHKDQIQFLFANLYDVLRSFFNNLYELFESVKKKLAARMEYTGDAFNWKEGRIKMDLTEIVDMFGPLVFNSENLLSKITGILMEKAGFTKFYSVIATLRNIIRTFPDIVESNKDYIADQIERYMGLFSTTLSMALGISQKTINDILLNIVRILRNMQLENGNPEVPTWIHDQLTECGNFTETECSEIFNVLKENSFQELGNFIDRDFDKVASLWIVTNYKMLTEKISEKINKNLSTTALGCILRPILRPKPTNETILRIISNEAKGFSEFTETDVTIASAYIFKKVMKHHDIDVVTMRDVFDWMMNQSLKLLHKFNKNLDFSRQKAAHMIRLIISALGKRVKWSVTLESILKPEEEAKAILDVINQGYPKVNYEYKF